VHWPGSACFNKWKRNDQNSYSARQQISRIRLARRGDALECERYRETIHCDSPFIHSITEDPRKTFTKREIANERNSDVDFNGICHSCAYSFDYDGQHNVKLSMALLSIMIPSTQFVLVHFI
jgi:hypothetical protein